MHSSGQRIALAAFAVLGAGALTLSGCAGQASDGPAELKIQVWGDTQYTDTMADLFAEVAPDDAEDVTIDVVSAGQGDGEAVEAFRLALSSGKDIPDIVQLNYSQVAEFAEAGVLADLGDLVMPYEDGLSKAAIELSQYDGTTVAVPYEVKSKLWFYRSDLFEQAGIDVASVKTQEDFVAAGEKLKAAFPESSIWNLGPNPQGYAWNMILSGNDATFTTREPCEIVVGTDEGTAAAFQAIHDLRESGVVATDYDDFSPEWQTALADGTLTSTLSASWLPLFLSQYAPDLAGKWAVTTWPEIGGAVGGSEAGGSVFVIPDASPDKEAAVKFLGTMLMEEDGARAFAVAVDYIPNVVAVQNDPTFADNDYFGTSLIEAYQAADEDYRLFPFDPNYAKEFSVLQGAMTEYLASGQDSPASFLQTAQDQLTSQIGCPYGS